MARNKTLVPTSSNPPVSPQQAERASISNAPSRIDELGVREDRACDAPRSTGVGLFIVAPPIYQDDGLTASDEVESPNVVSS